MWLAISFIIGVIVGHIVCALITLSLMQWGDEIKENENG